MYWINSNVHYQRTLTFKIRFESMSNEGRHFQWWLVISFFLPREQLCHVSIGIWHKGLARFPTIPHNFKRMTDRARNVDHTPVTLPNKFRTEAESSEFFLWFVREEDEIEHDSDDQTKREGPFSLSSFSLQSSEALSFLNTLATCTRTISSRWLKDREERDGFSFFLPFLTKRLLGLLGELRCWCSSHQCGCSIFFKMEIWLPIVRLSGFKLIEITLKQIEIRPTFFSAPLNIP